MFSVEKLGQAAEVEVLPIRYYEQIGLVPAAERSRAQPRQPAVLWAQAL